MGRFTKRFTEKQERAILSLYFTNPFGDVSFVIPGRDFGPEEAAAEAAIYSRSPEPYQKRFLMHLEKEPDLDMDYIDSLVKDPTLANKGLLVGVAAKAATHRFHTRWTLGLTEKEKDTALRSFGDDSIKEAANVLYLTERISDHDNKIISSNAKDRPQVKSSRYQEWNSDEVRKFVRENPDIQASRYADRIVDITNKLLSAYERFNDECAVFVEEHPLNLEFREFYFSEEAINESVEAWVSTRKKRDPDFHATDGDLAKQRGDIVKRREENYIKYARKAVTDSTRYLLFPAIPVNMAVASDARTLEEDITNLLSSPLESAVRLGETILEEGRKIMPTLLGKGTHARKSDFQVELREALTQFAKDRFEFDRTREYEESPRVSSLDGKVQMFTDLQLATTQMFPYTYGSFMQIAEHFKKHPHDVREVRDILKDLLFKVVNNVEVNRYEPLPPELLHGGLMTEMLIDWGAYRDIQRHRRGFKSRQLHSTYLRFETPSLIEMAGLGNDFREIMREIDETFREIVDDNPYVAQLMVPFAFKVRSLYSWSFGQDAYFAKLRSGPGGHISYRKAAWDVFEKDKERMPLFSELVKVKKY